MSGFKFDADGAWIEKDPGAKLWYGLYLGDWLSPGDVLATVSFQVPDGMSKLAEQLNAQPLTMTVRGRPVTCAPGTVAMVRLVGCLPGRRHLVTCHWVTAGGDEDERSFGVVCMER